MDVFDDVSYIVLRGRRNTLATFSEDELYFSWQALHFGRVHLHFRVAGAALQTCHVECFVRITLAGLREVVTKCKLPGRRGNL